MLALVPTAPLPHTMLLGQELLYLLRNSSELEAFPSQIGTLLGKYWPNEICFLLVGLKNENPWQTIAWHQGKVQVLAFTKKFWKQGWVRRIQSHAGPLTLPPGLTEQNNSEIKGKWKLTPTLSIASGLALCTSFQGGMNGLLMLGSSQVRQWTAEEIDCLTDLQDALGIANHLMLLQGDRFSADSSSQMAIAVSRPRHLGTEDNSILKRWYEATRQQLEQQREWNEQLIHNIVTIMSDQTRNPLATIRMGIEILRKCPPSADNLQQRLDIIEKEWRKLNEINEKILKLRTIKFDHTSFCFQAIELIPFLEDFLETDHSQISLASHKYLNIKTYWPDGNLILKIDVHCLEQVLQELLVNAEKFLEDGTAIAIEVKEKFIFGQSKVEIHVRNQSRCISPKNLKYLFDPFYREQWVIDSAIPGIGLGLSIIKSLVEQLDGTLEVQCDDTDSTDLCLINFVLAFPTERP